MDEPAMGAESRRISARIEGSEILRIEDAKAMVWANGAGATVEILRHAEDRPEFDWRVSVASVESSGPFSILEGIDRTIVFCEGPSMRLRIGERLIDLERGVPFNFSGDSETYGLISDGPTRDLNIMVNRRTAIAESTVVEIDGEYIARADNSDCVVIALTDGIRVASDDIVPLKIFDAVRLQSGTWLTLEGHGSGLLVRFRRRPEPV